MQRLTTIKAYEELSGGRALTPAEIVLIAACRAGTDCKRSQTRPETPTPETQIRADLLRLLITGASPACGLPDFGVSLHGAYITGTLNLDFATARGMTTLDACTFAEEPQMMQTHLHHLSLQHSHLPGLGAPQIVVSGSVLLKGLSANGTVDVSNAKIGRDLDCKEATFSDLTLPKALNRSLNANGVTVGGNLNLEEFTAKGKVFLGSADIKGSLNCTKSSFDANCLPVKGKHPKGVHAFYAQRMTVGQGFVWKEVTVSGPVYLAAAHVGDLVDDLDRWPNDLVLDGFTYDRISAA